MSVENSNSPSTPAVNSSVEQVLQESLSKSLMTLPTSSLIAIDSSSVVNNENSDTTYKPPASLQELLRLSTTLQSSSRNQSMPPPEMDEERTTFLREALKSISVDVKEEIKIVIANLLKMKDATRDIDKHETMLEELVDQVCCLDMACLFYQLGGLDALMPLLHHRETTLRWRAVAIITECCKNNPFCSGQSVGDSLFSTLMELATMDNNRDIQVHAIAAISAIVRNNPVGISQFQKYNGFSMLKDALTSGKEKVVVKAAFLIMSLCSSNNGTKDKLVEVGVIEVLISLARLTDNLMAEYFIRTLLSLTRDHDVAIQECLNNEYSLRAFLEKIINTKQEDEACQELVECTRELQKRLEGRNIVQSNN